ELRALHSFPTRRSSDLADISEALRQQILSALHFRTLGPGRRLPSARRLAAELRADPRVVLAAYRGLEREGLVERRPPSRAFYVRSEEHTSELQSRENLV